MNRAEHLAWCKQRALVYVDCGDIQTLASLISDLAIHPGTAETGAVVAELGMSLAAAGHLSTSEQMREWVQRCRLSPRW